MVIEIALSTIPPRISRCEPDDFKRFDVLTRGAHAYVSLDDESRRNARIREQSWLDR